MVQNFLPSQYESTGRLAINHNYLQQQFADYPEILSEIGKLVERGDFTLGRAVDDFELLFARKLGIAHALGVGSGTDALMLSLKALGVGPGDEVITTPYTFFATIGAIVTAGARPVFVDVLDNYNIDPARIEAAVTSRTKAILPVHWSGLMCDMKAIRKVADKHGLKIVEDACHAFLARKDDYGPGELSDLACFSMHPLKNLNVWGDGGAVVSKSAELTNRMRLLRNHGLVNRDVCEVFAYNSRLDTLQAIVANHVLKAKIEHITEARIRNATGLDKRLAGIPQLTVPARAKGEKHVFHIYVIRAERRDELQKHLVAAGIDAKVHYPIPMHLQPAAKEFGHRKGDFPNCEAICDSVISLPVHEYVTDDQLDAMAASVRRFYGAAR